MRAPHDGGVGHLSTELEHAMWATQRSLQSLRAQILELESRLERGELAGALDAGAALEEVARTARQGVERMAHAERVASRGRDNERFWVRVADNLDRTLDVFGPLDVDAAYDVRDRHLSSIRRAQVLEAGPGTSARIREWWNEVALRRRTAAAGAAAAPARAATGWRS